VKGGGRMPNELKEPKASPAKVAYHLTQLGKLGVHRSDQGDSCKTEPFWPQSHQRVTAVSQNAARSPAPFKEWFRYGTNL
jgi:hypothetical protein